MIPRLITVLISEMKTVKDQHGCFIRPTKYRSCTQIVAAMDRKPRQNDCESIVVFREKAWIQHSSLKSSHARFPEAHG